MESHPSLLVLGLMTLIVAGARLTSGADDAFLLATKKVVTKKVAGGEEITLSFTIRNAGGSTAYDVSLEDNYWPEDIFNVTGDVIKSWDTLESGGILEHSFVVKPKEKKEWPTPGAVVQYRTASMTTPQTLVSTYIPTLDLLSDKPPEKQYEHLVAFARKYGPFFITITLVGSFLLLVFTPHKAKKYSKSLKRR